MHFLLTERWIILGMGGVNLIHSFWAPCPQNYTTCKNDIRDTSLYFCTTILFQLTFSM